MQRMFREVHGKNIHAFVRSRRLVLAKELLADPSKTITKIANACGYSAGLFYDIFSAENRVLAQRVQAKAVAFIFADNNEQDPGDVPGRKDDKVRSDKCNHETA